jgi:hypothetical protein
MPFVRPQQATPDSKGLSGQGVKERVIECFCPGNPLAVVDCEHPIEQIEREVGRDSVGQDELMPGFLPFAGNLRGDARRHLEPVLLSIVDDLFPTEDLREPDDLLRVFHVLEEGDAPEKQ